MKLSFDWMRIFATGFTKKWMA